jgi:molybdopterin/thiamine biosynthesis adenylyltransferase
MVWSGENTLRYSRNILVEELGEAGQERLFASSVLVVGAGGLGSPALLYLAAAGIGRIGVIDDDRVDITNLNRQVIHRADAVGQWKADSAAAALRAFRPDLAVDAYPEALTAANAAALFRGYDAIVDGSDNFSTKYLCNDAAVVTGRPLVHAGVLRFGGQMLTVVPGEGPCLRCVLPRIPSRKDSPGCAEAGIVGAAAGVVGAWQAMEAIKLLSGITPSPGGKLLTIDTLSNEVSCLALVRDRSCPACGEHPRITEPLSAAEYDSEWSCIV